MNILKLFPTILLTLLLLGSCSSEEIIQNAPETNVPAIHLRLGGSAKAMSGSRAADLAGEENERDVKSLHALLFDTHKGFVGVEEARPTGPEGEYDVPVKEDATYDIWFVANADDNLLAALKAIPDTTKARNATAYLQKVFAEQAPEGTAGGFLMRSNKLKRVTTTITRNEDLGEVLMTRMAARFDIVNQAEGVTVTEITFKNRAVKSALYKPNFMPQEEGWFKDETYYPVNFEGTKDPEQAQARAYRHEIYSYRNTTMDPDSIPVLTLKYTETDSEGKTVTRTHDVKFIDPKAPSGTPLAINANYLYTITLTKAYKLEFNLTVEDWNEAETFNVPDLTVELDPSVQDSLNKALLVYDLFAEYNVKTLDLNNKTATFFDGPTNQGESAQDSYFSYSQLNNAGLTKNDPTAYINVDGVDYRMPTRGELELLVPLDDKFMSEGATGPTPRNSPVFADSKSYLMSTEEYTDTIYLKNGTNNRILKETDFSDEKTAFIGSSQLKKGMISTQIYYAEEIGYLDEKLEGCTTGSRFPVYGLRFKNTNQFAAYKWEMVCGTQYPHISIKIKALPKESDITVYDIADNISFWKDGFFEVKVPICGYFNNGFQSVTLGYILSSSLSESNNHFTITIWPQLCKVRQYGNQASLNYKYPLRLVKVKN